MRLADRLSTWCGALLAGAPLLLAAGPAPAQPFAPPPRDCLAGATPRLVVERKTVPVALDTRRTIAALSADLKPAVAGGGKARALGKAEVDHRLVIEPSLAIEARGGQVCAVPTEVRLIVSDVRRTILIAREVTGDACLNREVMAHEQRHIGVGEQVVAATLARAEPSLRAALARQRVAPRASAEAAAAATRAVIVAWFEDLHRRFEAESTRLNDAIDSPSEYRRLSTVCGARATEVAVVAAPPTVTVSAAAATPAAAAPARGLAINPAPPLPPSPVFRGTVDVVEAQIAIRLRPLTERAVVTVTMPAGAPQAREVSEQRLTVERQGNDLVQVRRAVMAARGLAGRWMPARVVTDTLGTVKAVTDAAVQGPVGDGGDPLQVFAHELAPRVTRAIAEIWQPRFPARGVQPGDVINQAAGDDGVVRYAGRMVVRGTATVEDRPVLVVDHEFSIETIGPSVASRGYGLIDLETGFFRHADHNQVTTTLRAGQPVTQQARVITSVVEAPR